MMINKISMAKKIRPEIVIVALILALSLFIYSQVHNYDFINIDDDIYVYDNDHIYTGITLENIKWAFSFSSDKTYWHPLTWLSHMVDCQFFGLDPGKHHLFNVLIHIINSLLLFSVLRLMTAAPWRSGIIAVLFAVHPINVDSVAWISERKNLLSTFFWFMTMLSYIYYSRNPGVKKYLMTALLFIMGNLSKPMLITLPFALILLDFWPLKRFQFPFLYSEHEKVIFKPKNWTHLILEKVPFILISFVFIWLSMFSLERIGVVASSETVSISLRISNAIVSYLTYMGKLIWPQNLMIYYPFPKLVPAWKVISSGLILVIITIFSLRHMRRKPYIIVGWLWFVGTLVPVIGLVQAGLWPAIAERWTYVPQIGFFLLIIWGISDLQKKWKHDKRLIVIAFSIILLTLTIVSKRQVRYWENSSILLEHALEINSENYIAHNNLGWILQSENKFQEAIKYFSESIRIEPRFKNAYLSLAFCLAELGQIDEGIKTAQYLLLIFPDSGDAHVALGYVLFKQGKISEAIDYYNKGLSLGADFCDVYLKTAIALAAQKKYTEAIPYYQELLVRDSLNPKVRYNYGVLLQAMKKPQEALTQYSEAIRLNPDLKEAHVNKGLLLDDMGITDESIFHYSEALRIDANFEKAHNSWGASLSRQGKHSEAIEHYSAAVKIKPDYAEAHNNWGVALFNMGKASEAISHFKEALRINPAYQSARNNLVSVTGLVIDNSIVQIKNALEGDPANPDLHFQLGNLYTQKKLYNKAYYEYHKALEIQPYHTPSLVQLAYISYLTGQFENAAMYYRKMLETDPENSVIYYNLACVYSMNNDLDGAKYGLISAIEKGYNNWDSIKKDVDLQNLRASSHYQDIVRKYNIN